MVRECRFKGLERLQLQNSRVSHTVESHKRREMQTCDFVLTIPSSPISRVLALLNYDPTKDAREYWLLRSVTAGL